ncbi:pirin family protein [Mariprofundus erugo]|uniref:Pirin family protein n=1 Tax=Mariprofundus erugo TaxID=2528639 RepID=A0A5R9GVN2_9PROT|nr:pirin family protein [Mariprofundus erugo]TLS68293.1 pirin family protein [Mariprofundus erugo]TLS77148.1 pirin family protein [Mariprofundus erugo]
MITVKQAVRVPEGDGVTVKRVMPLAGMRNFDPFVLWDDFDITGGGFPAHPHRGFEAITYLFAGGMRHADNLGNSGTIHAGGAQCFTAGSGIVHSEFPEGRAHGIQLWINLPRQLKGIPPAYQQVEAEEIPETHDAGVTIRTIAGEGGAISLHTGVDYLEIRIGAGQRFERTIAESFRGFIYMVEGEALLNDDVALHSGDAAFIEDMRLATMAATTDCRLMWCFGSPHHQPIMQHGPFVD